MVGEAEGGDMMVGCNICQYVIERISLELARYIKHKTSKMHKFKSQLISA